MTIRPAFAGILSGVLGLALLLVYLRRVEREATGGRKVQVLTAVSTIARGKPITEAMLGTRDVPMAYVDARVIRAADKDKIVNLRAAHNVPVQESLVWTDVVLPSDDDRALGDLVQPGNRAMPIRVHIHDVLPLIRPGDFVDVLCVCGEAKEASVLLQRVLVLATGTVLSLEPGRKESDLRTTVLTVSVSLQESQLLAIAMEKGTLAVIVRNPNDARVAEAPADVGATALGDSTRRQLLQSPRRRSQSPAELKEIPR